MGLRKFLSKTKPGPSVQRAKQEHRARFITGVSHINVGVPDLTRAINFYKSFLGAEPARLFPHFKNRGFAQSAGFVDAPDDVEVSIAFLDIPGAQLMLELMEYHNPPAVYDIHPQQVNDIHGVRHVALRVNDIDQAFENAQTESGVRMISQHDTYRPFTISKTKADQFMFFDPAQERDIRLKETTAQDIGTIRYFYCVDPYGVQWEFEQGNTDIGY